MHLLGQGWKRQPDGVLVVAAIAVSRCTNGMDGWQMHVGCYNPALGESISQAKWEFKVASGNLMGVLNPYVVCEVAAWGDTQATDIKEALARIEALLRDMKEKLCPS